MTPAAHSTANPKIAATSQSPIRDFVRPDEIAEYKELRTSLLAEIQPTTAIERVYADEIVTAAWRLRRCATLEDSLSNRAPDVDPMENLETARLQLSIDRARALAHRILRGATIQLREMRRHRTTNAVPQAAAEPVANHGTPTTNHTGPITIESQTPAPAPISIARNATCRCGSGQKYKRCCGHNAPPLLGFTGAGKAA